MGRLARIIVVGLTVTLAAEVALAIVANLFTNDIGWPLGIGVGILALVVLGIRLIVEWNKQADETAARTQLLEEIRAIGSTTSGPSRTELLALAAKRADARRRSRLLPYVDADRVDEVVDWTLRQNDPVVVVGPGGVGVIAAPIGAGKTEVAARWWDDGLQEAAADDDVDIPVWLTARDARAGLEGAVAAAVDGNLGRRCRVVVDDLDGVTHQDAQQILAGARQLVQVYPAITVLLTTRPGVVDIVSGERISVEPWPATRGEELVRLVLDDDVPHRIWSSQTAEVLTSPLLALALAVRLRAGGDTQVTRVELLSGLARDVLSARLRQRSTPQVWGELARLATVILDGGEAVRAESFGNDAEVWQLTDTTLVVNDAGRLSFALPLFEQHFASQAITSGLASLEAVASGSSFPRWRYAIAFAVTVSSPPDAERLMIDIAGANPACASWVLDEVSGNRDRSLPLDTDDSVIEDYLRRHRTGPQPAGTVAVRAVRWLRDAETAMLTGFGPCAPLLATYKDGQPVGWGAWLQGGWVTVAERREAHEADVVDLDEIRPPITIASPWAKWSQHAFPDDRLGRWWWTRDRIRARLQRRLRARTLPTPPGSPLTEERLWYLARFITELRGGRAQAQITVDTLRDKVAEMMVTVEASVSSHWTSGSGQIDSDDVRWIDQRLRKESRSVLAPPLPPPDQGHLRHKWAWEAYSPQLTHTLAEQLIRDALIGYRQLITANLPTFGGSLDLNSLLPASVTGAVIWDRHPDNFLGAQIALTLNREPRTQTESPAVTLELITNDSDATAWWQTYGSRGRDRTTTPLPGGQLHLPVNTIRPATNIAYKWLWNDLHHVGWTDSTAPFYD